MNAQPIQFEASAYFAVPVRPKHTQSTINGALCQSCAELMGARFVYPHTFASDAERFPCRGCGKPSVCNGTVAVKWGEQIRDVRSRSEAELAERVQFLRAAFSVASILSIQHERAGR